MQIKINEYMVCLGNITKDVINQNGESVTNYGMKGNLLVTHNISCINLSQVYTIYFQFLYNVCGRLYR